MVDMICTNNASTTNMNRKRPREDVTAFDCCGYDKDTGMYETLSQRVTRDPTVLQNSGTVLFISAAFLPWDPNNIFFVNVESGTTWNSVFVKLGKQASQISEKKFPFLKNVKRLGLTKMSYDYKNSQLLSGYVPQIYQELLYISKIDFGNGWENLMEIDENNDIQIHKEVYSSVESLFVDFCKELIQKAEITCYLTV